MDLQSFDLHAFFFPSPFPKGAGFVEMNRVETSFGNVYPGSRGFVARRSGALIQQRVCVCWILDPVCFL